MASEPRIDRIDRHILTLLQQDGRLTMQEISDRVGLSPTPVLRRIRLMEEAGLIKGYVALVDQKRAGLPVSVFVSVRLERQREDALLRFSKAIADWPEVMECYLMTGRQDFLLRVVVASLEDYDQFLKSRLTRLEGVASIESSFALAQEKYTSALPLREM
ncbi:Lrp/AsnC family transcriptional regulator [Fuscibacter oryzae]|uniref:Lrp/AsnC family transcriptional regulator n=1 Tax=Fuscibacter oryzae TaxID=2803939 RepID=A0A8J7MSJ5_9RHOB|nr:Lrp/AsnC family transcriptional regulator [Fuscibacter oryzae]MBL4929772.1 Lrp/AsnC family transcriptional regulator [Fuscibacter oryzae]